MTLINVFFDFIDIVQGKINLDQQERNVHLFTDFNSFFQCETICLDGFIILFMIVKDLCLFKKCISDLSLTKIFLSIFDLQVSVFDEFFERFLDLHVLDRKSVV